MPTQDQETSDISQMTVETITRSWELTDKDEAPLIPASVSFYAEKEGVVVTWGVGTGVVNNGDGTGTWKVTAGDLAKGNWEYFGLFGIGSDLKVPRNLKGKLTVT